LEIYVGRNSLGLVRAVQRHVSGGTEEDDVLNRRFMGRNLPSRKQEYGGLNG
jgi:hypothetical protein